MAIIEKTFHLGKRPYTFNSDNAKIVTLIGQSLYDSETQKCCLYFHFYEHSKSEKLNLNKASFLNDETLISSFSSRSEKFRTGDFTDNDSQRYIKSRYRDILQELNRNRLNKQSIVKIIKKYQELYNKTDEMAQFDTRTSAELANEIDHILNEIE